MTDEVWDDARVKGFLEMTPPVGESADFHVLVKAYRGMRPDDFERFLRFFVEAGRDMNARDNQGRTLWEVISNHRHAGEFLAARSRIAG